LIIFDLNSLFKNLFFFWHPPNAGEALNGCNPAANR